MFRRSVLGTPVLLIVMGALVACPETPAQGPDVPIDGCPDCSDTVLKVPTATARSCEALVGVEGGTIDGIKTAAGIQGQHVREGERVGLAFAATTDEPMPSNAMQVVHTGVLNIISSVCYDPQGEPLVGSPLTL